MHTNGTGTGSIALPCTTATAHRHTAPPEDKLPEQDQDFLIKGLINRPPMVGLTSNNSIQQHSINPTSIRYGHIHGCIHTGMGGPMQWNIDGGTLDSPGIQEPHQRSQVKSCSTTKKSVTAPRSRGHECGCNDLAMEQMDIINSLPNSNATSHTEEDSGGPVDLSAHCPKLAGTDMVSTPAAVVDRHPRDFANVYNIFTIQPASQASTVANAETRGMAAFRGRCEAGGLPPQVCDILMASWRDGTKKRYEGPWKLWLAGVCQGISGNLSYRTIGVYKSCISQLRDPVGGQPLGTLPLLARFMKGIFRVYSNFALQHQKYVQPGQLKRYYNT